MMSTQHWRLTYYYWNPTPSSVLTVTPAIITTYEVSRSLFFFFQAEDGIRDSSVTGVQTCALPISLPRATTNESITKNWPSLPKNISPKWSSRAAAHTRTSSLLHMPCQLVDRQHHGVAGNAGDIHDDRLVPAGKARRNHDIDLIEADEARR